MEKASSTDQKPKRVPYQHTSSIAHYEQSLEAALAASINTTVQAKEKK